MEDFDFRRLDYESDGFAVSARKLLVAGVPFSFEIAGKARDQLLPRISGAGLSDIARLGLHPKLQRLLGVLILAETNRRTVTMEQSQDSIRFSIGAGSA